MTTCRRVDNDVHIPPTDLTSFVFEHVDEWADKLAFVDGDSGRELSYRDLGADVARLAAGLTVQGFRTGDVVGLLLSNVPEYAVAFHGVAAAGAVCTTINPSRTAAEIAHQLCDAGARLVITVPSLAPVALKAADDAGVEGVAVFGHADGCIPITDLLHDPDGGSMKAINASVDLVALPYSAAPPVSRRG